MAKRWFAEKDPFSPINYRYAIDRVLHQRRSPIQEIKVLEHSVFGRILVLDDVVQLTERDEFFYHEMLAHVPLHSHPRPERVLVIGGGDGGTLREALRHPTVRSGTLVDIDNEVTEVCREYFPSLTACLSDPRVTIAPNDGAVFIAETREKFDAVLIDAPDPVGPARTLTTPEFFGNVRRALTERGILAMQTESLHFHIDFVRRIQGTLASVFPWVGLYFVPLATYAGNFWTISIASNRPLPQEPLRPPVAQTHYYCEDVHRRCWVPPQVVDGLARRFSAFQGTGAR